MSDASIEVKGLAELTKKLDAATSATMVRGILAAGAEMLKSYIAVYPNATQANSPSGPGSRWYERGFGSKWQRMDGSVNGRQTSEVLGRRWTISVRDTEAIVGNNTSYGPFVQSAERQAAVHRRNQWRTDVDAIREVGPRIQDMAAAEIQRAVNEA